MNDADERSARRGMPEMIKAWRERRRPSQIPELAALPEHMRRSPVLTQTMMATLLGITERHYRRIEHGERRVSDRLLVELCRILDLPEAERAALYLWAGREPPRHQHTAELEDALMDFIEEQRHGAYWSDGAYDVRGCNRLAAHHFPWLTEPGANIMIDLLSPGGAGRPMLHRWEDLWVPPMVAQLRLAEVRYPDSRRLEEVIRTVRRDPVVRRIWDEPAAELRAHAFGDVRPMLVPTYGTSEPVWVRIMAFGPLHRPDLRLVVVTPVSHAEPGTSGLP